MSKACDYIRELRQNNQQLQESYKEVERVEMDNELLRQQVHGTHHNYAAAVSQCLGATVVTQHHSYSTVRTYTDNILHKLASQKWRFLHIASYLCPCAGQDVDACRANKDPLAASLLYNYCCIS